MALCLLVFFLCLCFPGITGSGIKNGLSLIGGQVLPALYPFILLTTLFKYLAGRRPANQCLSIFIGFLSGYPLGAKVAAGHNPSTGFLSGQSLLLICNNPSPAYMISFIGLHCFGAPFLGFRMYIAVITGNLITGLFFALMDRTWCQDPVQSEKIPSFSKGVPSTQKNLLDQVIHDTFSVIVNVSSYILVFSVAAAFIQRLSFLPEAAQGLLSGLLEMTTGVQILVAQSIPMTTKVLLTTGIISFGGLSVMAQTNSMIAGSDLSIKKYMTEKTIACAIAVSVMYMIYQ
ncbi:hypothetical protein [Frisingicoccus sp.]|uniref:hypothetical protein n=1 Tax=Frisingicoccus sp. TaxID=1918627 RepID=UPI0039968A78